MLAQPGENCAKHLKKGSKVGICGSVQTRTYDDRDGVKRYVTEIIADEVQFLSTRNDDERDSLPDIPEVSSQRKPRMEDARPVEVSDDDLPF